MPTLNATARPLATFWGRTFRSMAARVQHSSVARTCLSEDAAGGKSTSSTARAVASVEARGKPRPRQGSSAAPPSSGFVALIARVRGMTRMKGGRLRHSRSGQHALRGAHPLLAWGQLWTRLSAMPNGSCANVRLLRDSLHRRSTAASTPATPASFAACASHPCLRNHGLHRRPRLRHNHPRPRRHPRLRNPRPRRGLRRHLDPLRGHPRPRNPRPRLGLRRHPNPRRAPSGGRLLRAAVRASAAWPCGSC